MPRNNAADRAAVARIIEGMGATLPAEQRNTYAVCASLPRRASRLVIDGVISPWAAREFGRMVDIAMRDAMLADISNGHIRCPSTSRLREMNASQRRANGTARAARTARPAVAAPAPTIILSAPERSPRRVRTAAPAPAALPVSISAADAQLAERASRSLADAVSNMPRALNALAQQMNEILDELSNYSAA